MSFQIKSAVTDASYYKCTTKLIKLFDKIDFVVSFNISRKKIKKDSKNGIFNTSYQTKLAVVEVKINKLEESLLSQLNMLEKQQYFHLYEDGQCLLNEQKTELDRDLDLH